jgi:hypothetical protein
MSFLNFKDLKGNHIIPAGAVITSCEEECPPTHYPAYRTRVASGRIDKTMYDDDGTLIIRDYDPDPLEIYLWVCLPIEEKNKNLGEINEGEAEKKA